MGMLFLRWIDTSLGFYLLLIFIYVMASWFPGPWSRSKVMYWLTAAVSPYLNWFRKIRFLQVGMVDFSPILGIAVIYFVRSLLRMMQQGRLSAVAVGQTAVLLLLGVGSSLVNLLLILLVVRLAAHFFFPRERNTLFRMIEAMAEWIHSRTLGFFSRSRPSLLVVLVGALVVSGLLRWGLSFLVRGMQVG